MDFSQAGIKEAIIRFFTVVAYVALSGAITELVNYFKPMEAGEYSVVFTAINAGLAAAQKWVTTKR